MSIAFYLKRKDAKAQRMENEISHKEAIFAPLRLCVILFLHESRQILGTNRSIFILMQDH